MNHLIGAIGTGTIRAVLTPQASKRHLISMRGPDTFKFLQSMCTKRVISFEEADAAGELCDYTAFLTSKGRVAAEALLMFRPLSKTWLIDVPTTSVEPLLSHMQQYKMRNNISWETEEINKTYKLWTLVTTNETNLKEISLWILNKTSQMEILFSQDPRFPLSLRLLCPSHLDPMTKLPPLGDILMDKFPEKQSIYTYLRNVNGIPECEPQIESLHSIPFETNLDQLNGIDYDKGCYLGQELVARTHFRGAVRKRLFPLVSLGSPSQLIQRTQQPNNSLINTLMEQDLATGEHVILPQQMLTPIALPKVNGKSSTNKNTQLRANMEISSIYSAEMSFPEAGRPILPIKTQSDLEAILSGTLPSAPTGATASRISKAVGGSSWNVGMGMMRTDAWDSSPHLLFYSPASDGSGGTILKGVKPLWYNNYLQWKEKAELKAIAQATEEL